MNTKNIVYDPMPKRINSGRDVASIIDTVIHTRKRWLSGDPTYTGKSNRFIMGYPLPDFQRSDDKWSLEQKVKLIDNIWKRVSIGSFMINVLDMLPEHQYDGWLIDGQQRLKAIEEYLNDGFTTKDINGNDMLWSKLPIVSQRRFKNSHFHSIHVSSTNREELVEIYNTFNFGGVKHTENERAT